jgi:hypothetical protein
MISNQLFDKSLQESLIMLFRLPITSTTSFPNLSHLKQSEMHSSTMTFALLLSRNIPCLKRPINWSILDLPGTMKIGQWRIGRGSCGQMRLKSTGLGQMEGCILGRRRENHFLTGPLHLQSSMEEGTILWYGDAWGGMGWESSQKFRGS